MTNLADGDKRLWVHLISVYVISWFIYKVSISMFTHNVSISLVHLHDHNGDHHLLQLLTSIARSICHQPVHNLCTVHVQVAMRRCSEVAGLVQVISRLLHKISNLMQCCSFCQPNTCMAAMLTAVCISNAHRGLVWWDCTHFALSPAFSA